MPLTRQQMLTQMCQQVLSNADIKAIGKARGFSAQETASRASFENFMLSDIGVEKALRLLTDEEIILLHLLKQQKKPVDVSFFKHYYDPETKENNWYRPTFTQRHQKTLRTVKSRLLRKGVLLMAEDTHAANANSKMERRRFCFPQEFHQFLTAPFSDSKILDTPGSLNETLLRSKLLEVTGKRSPDIRLRGAQYHLHLTRNRLFFGDKPFQSGLMQAWQKAEWAFDLQKHRSADIHSEKHLLGPLETTLYALARLKPNEWAAPQSLKPWLKVFCHPVALQDAAKICQSGWQWGCLLQQEIDGNPYYRLPDKSPLNQPDPPPEEYLRPLDNNSAALDLRLVPWHSLEYLNRIANLRASATAQLTLSPNITRMGRFFNPNAPAPPLNLWLQKNVPAFKDAVNTLKNRWGKQLVHQNLLIAKIKDLSLKLILQKAFNNPEQIIFLPNNYIVFPQNMLKAVEKQVDKSGHVIKWINNSQSEPEK